MDRRKSIFSSVLGAIRPKKKPMNPVFGDESKTLNYQLIDSSSAELVKANPVFAVSVDKSKTLDELIASWEAQPDVHFRNFPSKELMKATGNFNSGHLVNEDAYYAFYKGFFGKQPILIKKFKSDGFFRPSEDVNFVNIRDMVIASRLSSHGSSLNFIGCCQELSAQVFEYEGNFRLLSDGLYRSKEIEPLPWSNRLSVAHDIANALVILHTSFSTPIVLRDLKPGNILVNQSGVAKLLDFSLCVPIPVGESQVEDAVMGTYGFAEPQYVATGVLTEKIDVFSFGVVLLELLTGQRAVDVTRGESGFLHERVGESVKKGLLKKVVDHRMVEAGEFVEREQEYRALAVLALRCTREERKERPHMVDVAAEIARIQSANRANLLGKR